MAKTIVLLDPADFLKLAKNNGYSRNKAIALSGISDRTWCKWTYQKGFKPSINSQVKLATIASANGWL